MRATYRDKEEGEARGEEGGNVPTGVLVLGWLQWQSFARTLFSEISAELTAQLKEEMK